MGLAEEYKQLFFKAGNADDYFAWVGRTECVLSCYVEMYGIMAKENKLVRIEDLDAKTKTELWLEAKRILGEGAGNEQAIKLCKAIHFLGILIQE